MTSKIEKLEENQITNKQQGEENITSEEIHNQNQTEFPNNSSSNESQKTKEVNSSKKIKQVLSTSTLKGDTDADSITSNSSPSYQIHRENNSKKTEEEVEGKLMKNSEKKISKNFEKRRKLRDEIVFCLNLILTLVSTAMIFGCPNYFHYLNTIVYIVKFSHRLYEFHCYKWDFYLIDFCYVTNTTVILYSEYFKETEYWKFWFLSAFGFSLGPILFSNFVFNFGFVFHNTVKFTSFYTHLAPGVIMFLARWHNEKTKELVDNYIYSFFASGNSNALNPGKLKDLSSFMEIGNISFITPGIFFEFFLNVSVIYLSWFVIYYLIIFKIFYNFTENNGYLTQFGAMVENKKNRKHLKFFGDGFEGIAFMFVHLRYVSGCLVISFFFLFSYHLGLIALIACCLAPIWNASTYYVQYFSKNYMLQFDPESDLDKLTPI